MFCVSLWTARKIGLVSLSSVVLRLILSRMFPRPLPAGWNSWNFQALIYERQGLNSIEQLWLRGGFPRSFLAQSDDDSMIWREGFIRTFLERDIPQLGISIPAPAMRRFWTMLAHCHGQTWNASDLGRSMGLSDKTVRSYLDILTATFMVRQLQPWYENIGKRQVKAPKVYLRDSGVLHSLLNLPDLHSLLGHPRLGASWEGFALEQTLRIIKPSQAFYWATHSGAEIDLFLPFRGRRFGVEFQFSEAPRLSKSMRAALDDLNLDHLWLIYPGHHSFPVHEKISAWPLKEIIKLPERMQVKVSGEGGEEGKSIE